MLEKAEAQLFRSLRMPNGTYKTTAWRRLEPLDNLTVSLVQASEPVQLLDVGASSAVTTAELVTLLRSRFERVTAVAADLFMHAEIVRVPFGGEVLLHRASRSAVEASWGPIKIVDDALTLARPLSILRKLFMKLITAAVGLARAVGIPLETRPLNLVSRKASDESIYFVECDIFQQRNDWSERFLIVRAANILNKGYFSDDLLKTGIAHLASYVAPGGLLVLARCIGEEIHATVFRKDGTRLLVEARLGDGSEVEEFAAAP